MHVFGHSQPFCVPQLRGTNSYFDVMENDDLVEQAQKLGWPNGPDIDYVSESVDLLVVSRNFDVVFSGHAIDQQSNLVKPLIDVERLLHPGGAYFLIIPDNAMVSIPSCPKAR